MLPDPLPAAPVIGVSSKYVATVTLLLAFCSSIYVLIPRIKIVLSRPPVSNWFTPGTERK
jgi:hypothetical protein